MEYTVTLKATKYITLKINDAPNEEAAREFARLQVKTQFPIVEVIDIEDGELIEETPDATPEILASSETLSDMQCSTDDTGGEEDRTRPTDE